MESKFRGPIPYASTQPLAQATPGNFEPEDDDVINTTFTDEIEVNLEPVPEVTYDPGQEVEVTYDPRHPIPVVKVFFDSSSSSSSDSEEEIDLTPDEPIIEEYEDKPDITVSYDNESD